MADRWADQGVLASDNVRWNSPKLRPIFTWKVGKKLHSSTMSKGLKTRVNLIVAKMELLKHDGKTTTFLKKKTHREEILGKHWIDKEASMWAKRRLLQCVSYQFSCAKTFKIWGMWENHNCRLCRSLNQKV